MFFFLLDFSFKFFYGFIDVLILRYEMMVFIFLVLVCIFKDFNMSGLFFYYSSEDVEVVIFNFDKKFFVLNKFIFLKVIGFFYLKVVLLSERDVDSLKFRIVNVLVRFIDYLFLFVLEEEFIDELVKFFEGLLIFLIFIYFLIFLGGCYRLISDLYCLGLVRFFDLEVLSRICNEFLINDGFLYFVRKFDFNLEDFEKW